jgi:hypothetical protein
MRSPAWTVCCTVRPAACGLIYTDVTEPVPLQYLSTGALQLQTIAYYWVGIDPAKNHTFQLSYMANRATIIPARCVSSPHTGSALGPSSGLRWLEIDSCAASMLF